MNLNHIGNSPDIDYLAELMRDFPVDNPPTIDLAAKLVHLRFQNLKFESFSKALEPLTDHDFLHRFQSIPLKMHHYLFYGIFSNAGMYRNDRDPGGGVIYFGPNQKFRGFSPSNIPNGVMQACSLLMRDSCDPIESVTKFYQQFVLIHPFYDANGRIGRFMTSIFLDYHGFYIAWNKMHQNQRWIKKLNDCHKRPGDETYIKQLVKHWKKFIVLKSTIDSIHNH